MSKRTFVYTLAMLLLASPFNLRAQGGLFSDSAYFTDGLRAPDGGYYTRDWVDPGSHLARFDANMTSQWANDYAAPGAMGGTIRISSMDVLPDGSAVLVGTGGSIDMSQQAPYDTHHHVVVVLVAPDGTVSQAKDHVFATQNSSDWDQMDMDQYSWHPVSTSSSGESFISLRRDIMPYTEYLVMKVDAAGNYAWCARAPEGEWMSSKILADDAGGCFIVLNDDNNNGYDRIHVVHLGADGSTLWSKVIRRQGYTYISFSRLHQMGDGTVYVVTTSGQNLVRVRLDPTGQVEEHLLITSFPQPPSNYLIGVMGSAMAEDGSMTMFTDGGNMPYRAYRIDPTGSTIGAWTTPETVDGTWTTRFNIGSVQDEGPSFTALASLWREESVFGFYEGYPVVISSPLDLSGLCEITPLQFAQTALPLTQLEVTDGTPFTPVTHIGTNDIVVTVTPLSLEHPEDFCSFVGPTGIAEQGEEELLFPNPVARSGIVRLAAESGSQLRIVDAMGHCVRFMRTWGPVQEFTADFTPGVYSVLLSRANGVPSVSRLVVE